MDTDNKFFIFCPITDRQVTVTVSATLGNGCGCTLSLEDMEASCSETDCPLLYRKGCALNPFLTDAED